MINASAQVKKILNDKQKTENSQILTAADQPEKYLPLLKNKNVAIVTNQTGIITLQEFDKSDKNSSKTKTSSIVDYLVENKINIVKIFSPEHGFRGNADAGEKVYSGIDPQTGLEVISLYGNNKKPSNYQLKNINLIVFDLQDVGVRFYTYISTLHYVMEAAVENNIPLIVLDRPNPNAHYIDGPILEEKFKSFVGMHPVPIVYGMTIGEYAQMINGEKWLKNKISCNLTVIPLKNYTHKSHYKLPVYPSPNLKSSRAINLYPSLCFFEGTNVSEGRGTDNPFEVFGSPFLDKNYFSYSFIPEPNSGAKTPRYSGKNCYGEDLRKEKYQETINLKWLLEAFKNNSGQEFFNSDLFFDKLAGTDKLRKQIIAGKSEQEIKESWHKDLEKFKKIRNKYLLYKD